MLPLILPSARSTRAALARAAVRQAEIIAALRAMGEDGLADRLHRCHQDRMNRQAGRWPWLCWSAACVGCSRAEARRWWRGIGGWISGPNTSFAVLPIPSGDLINAVRQLRKAVRDKRDRLARKNDLFQGVSLGGLVSGGHLRLLIKHSGIDRETVEEAFRERWPEIVLLDVGTVEPTLMLTLQDAVAVGVRRRGVEPCRVIIPPQRRASDLNDEGADEPMPMAF